MNRESEGNSSGIPCLAKNERDTRISCTRHQATAAIAAFIEESRVKFINADKLHRKSGGMGHPSFVRESALPRICWLISQKAVVGFARLFRPTYAGANVGHPSYSYGVAV
jgi:hypothetical protein